MKQFRLIAAIIVGILTLGASVGLVMGNASSSLAAPVERNASDVADKIGPVLLERFQTEGQADFIVKFTEQADLTPAYTMDWAARGDFVVNTLQEAAERSQSEAKALLDARGLDYRTFIAGNELYVWTGNLEAATELAALSEVDFIRETRTYFIDPVETNYNRLENIRWAGDLLAYNLRMAVRSQEPAAPDALAWGISYTKADQFWAAFGLQGDSILVANIDTGVQWDHPALDQAFKCGTDPTDPACWEDPSNICGGSACDNNGHGTHTMGTMVADDDPSLTWQAGMAPNAEWIACKGCETNSCSDFALNTCADWILMPDGDPANRPHIVNNSWGGGGGDNWYLGKVQAWRAAGTYPAFSAGNSGPGCSTLGSPGDYQESFGSAAHDVIGDIAGFSSRGPSAFGHDPYTKPNIAAPGVGVCSSIPGDGWSCGYNGTSMASPHSAGAVALLWSCNPGLIGQIDTTFEVLQNSANIPPAGTCGAPPDGEGNYTFGYGYLDVLAAGGGVCGSVDFGYLDGYVTELATGDPIEGATVSALPAVPGGNNILAEAITDPNGYYTMTLVVATYDVTASKLNYSPQTVTGIDIFTGTVTTQDFQLPYLGSWSPGPSEAPFEYNRFDGVFNPMDSWIYFPGGRIGGAHDKSIWRYDPANDVWEDTTCDMLENAANITAVYIEDDGTARGEAIYVMGGYDIAAGVNIPDVQRYYPSQPGCLVENVTTDPYPDQSPAGFAIGAGGVAEVGGKIYVFGGWESTTPYFSDKTWEYDPLAPDGSRWTELTSAPLSDARAYIQAAAQGGLIYAMGGDTDYPGDLVPTDLVEVLDPANPGAGWQVLAPMPAATAQGRGFGFDADTQVGIQQPWSGKLYVVGGGDWPDASNSVYEYDIASDTWDPNFPDLLSIRRNHAGVFVPLCTPDPSDGLPGMWVFGGYVGSDNPPFGDPEFFPFEDLCPADIEVNAPPLEAGMFPNQMSSLEFTIGNVGGEPLDWNLFEISPTMKLVGQTLPQSTGISGRDVNLDFVTPEGGSVQTEPWDPMGPVTLVLDDGSVENYVGVNDGVNGIQFLWVNRFTPDPSEFPFTLDEIWVVFGGTGVDIGDDIQLIVYEDKDGDGDPTNASVVAAYNQTVQNDDGSSWNVYTLPSPVTLYGPGDVLIGVINRYQDGLSGLDYPAGIDVTASQYRSWIGWWGTAIAPDPPELPPVVWAVIDDLGLPGNWMVRGAGETMFEVVDFPWVSEDPISGTVDAGQVQTVTVTFDSTGLSAGDYFAQLLITSNDPGDPFVTLPVSLTVYAAGVEISAPMPAMSGDPGMPVTYTLQVANLGEAEDTFDIASSGNTWMVDVVDPMVTLPSMGVADVEVVVHVPLDAMAGDMDMVTISATSQGDPSVSDSVDLTTTANLVYGVELTPETAAMSGAPGERVEYTLDLMNTGNMTDTFDLTSVSTWNVHFPQTSVTLPGGGSAAVIVHVDIPSSASTGDSDVALIEATSQGDPTVADSSTLTTTAESYMIYLPIVFK